MRWIIVGAIAAAILGAAAYWGVPYLRYQLDTVSTDDAFVASHITNVSPRIEDVVTEVLVDENDRVNPGTLLVRLDREPFEVAAAQAQSALEEATANVAQSRAQVRSQIARAGRVITSEKTRRRRFGNESPRCTRSSPLSRAGRRAWSWRGTTTNEAKSSCPAGASARKTWTSDSMP